MGVFQQCDFRQEELESSNHQQDEDETQTYAAKKAKKASKRKSDVTAAEPKKKARTEKADKAGPKEKTKAKDTSKKVKGQRVVRSAVRHSRGNSLLLLIPGPQSVVPSSGEEDNGRQQATTSRVSVERHEKTDGVGYSTPTPVHLDSHATALTLAG